MSFYISYGTVIRSTDTVWYDSEVIVSNNEPVIVSDDEKMVKNKQNFQPKFK